MTDQEATTSSSNILTFLYSFVSAVLISSFVFISPLVSLFLILVGLAVLAAEKVYKRDAGKEVLLISIALISFGLGALRYEIKNFHTPVEPSREGIVVSEPEQRENVTRFVMRADNSEKVLVSSDLYSPVRYGDRVVVEGKFARPNMIDDGTGRPFDYAKYLSKDDIYFTMSFAKVEVVSSGHGNKIKHVLFGIKHSLVANIRKIFAEPESSLLAGLIVSGKDAMPKSILEEFRRAGVVHIVVLSGYNITIIADFIRKMFENIFIHMKLGLGPRAAAGASIVGILLFVLMTGAEPTVVRAAIMVLVVIAAKLFGRSYSAPRALLGAAFIMILFNPKILVFDPSFQLSFLATCALIYVVPIVERYLKFLPERWGTRTIISTTIATQLTVLPFLIYSMGDVSLVALPANILILFFIPYTMFTGFIAAVLAYVSTILAIPLAFVAHLFLSWILGVSHFLGNLSFATMSIPHFPFWAVLLSYAILITFLKLLRNSPHKTASSSF